MQLINANAALVELFIYSHIGHETLSMRTINTGIHRVCQIEFIKEIYQEQKIQFFMEKFVGCTDFQQIDPPPQKKKKKITVCPKIIYSLQPNCLA